jgi:hypothetical protein
MRQAGRQAGRWMIWQQAERAGPAKQSARHGRKPPHQNTPNPPHRTAPNPPMRMAASTVALLPWPCAQCTSTGRPAARCCSVHFTPCSIWAGVGAWVSHTARLRYAGGTTCSGSSQVTSSTAGCTVGTSFSSLGQAPM